MHQVEQRPAALCTYACVFCARWVKRLQGLAAMLWCVGDGWPAVCWANLVALQSAVEGRWGLPQVANQRGVQLAVGC